MLTSSFCVFGPLAGYHFHIVCPAVCCLGSFVGHFAGMFPLVQHFEQYGSSGQSFFRCLGCLHLKHIWSSGPPFDLGIYFSGVLGTALGCASAAGMKG